MGRKRSDFICLKCGKQGSLRRKQIKNKAYPELMYPYRYIEHYDSVTRKKSTCYVEKLMDNRELENMSNSRSEELIFLYNAKKRVYQMRRDVNRFVRRIKQYKVNLEDGQKISNAFNEQIELFLFAIETSIVYARLSLKGNLTTEEQEIWQKARKVINLVTELGEQLRTITAIRKQNENVILSNDEKLKLSTTTKLAIQFLKQPYIMELARFFDKYEKPILRLKKIKLKKKQSESAFGSDKYKSQYSGISEVN